MNQYTSRSAAIKTALRAAFPETKFSVRIGRGTAYGWPSVDWTDGPTSSMIEAVIAERVPSQAMEDSPILRRGISDEFLAEGVALVVQDADGYRFIRSRDVVVFADYDHMTDGDIARKWCQKVAA